MTETWKPILGFENRYEVSDIGRVRSLDRYVEQKNKRGGITRRLYAGRQRTLRTNKYGYVTVVLYRDGKGAHFNVHVLVLEAFIQPRPRGMEACHNDGSRDHNHVANLRWDTRVANLVDRHTHGTDFRGKQNPNARLSEADIAAIRAAVAPTGELAAEFKVSFQHILKIRRRERWAHV